MPGSQGYALIMRSRSRSTLQQNADIDAVFHHNNQEKQALARRKMVMTQKRDEHGRNEQSRDEIQNEKAFGTIEKDKDTVLVVKRDRTEESSSTINDNKGAFYHLKASDTRQLI